MVYVYLLAVFSLLPSFNYVWESWGLRKIKYPVPTSLYAIGVFILGVTGFWIDYLLRKEKSRIVNITTFEWICYMIGLGIVIYQFKRLDIF